MKNPVRNSSAFFRCGAVMCALLFVGFSPATLAANANALDAMFDVEDPNDWPTASHTRPESMQPVSDHCHLGSDCSPTAVVAGGGGLIADTTNVKRVPRFGDRTLAGGTPTFEPPPPRVLSGNTGNSENTQDSKDKA